MVAVRGSHLLNPKDFEIEKWCANLNVAENVKANLMTAWHYSQQKMTLRTSAGRSPFADLRRGNGGNPQQLKHGCR